MEAHSVPVRFFLRMSQRECGIYAHLPDMVCAEGGCDGYPLRLAEGVILHRADEVHGDVRYLVRRTFRDKRKYHNRRHLNADEQRVPADKPVFLDGVSHSLGDKSAEGIRRHGYKIVHGPRPLRLADGEAEEHEVRRLGVAENAAARVVSEAAEIAAHEDQQCEHPLLFTFEIFAAFVF